MAIPEEVARNIEPPWIRNLVVRLLDNLDGRSGFDLCDIDEETLTDWAHDWAQMIDSAVRRERGGK